MLNIDAGTFGKSLGVLQSVTKSKQNFSKKKIQFQPFVAKNHSFRIAAVDGSNININGVGFVIAALRAGSIVYKDGEVEKNKKNISPIKIEVLINSDDKEMGYLTVYKNLFRKVIGDLPGEYLDFEKAPERIRTLMEWEAISDLVETLQNGDIIIFDGSLISGTISTSKEYYSNLITKAKSKGISLVGLSKDTGLLEENVPIPSILREAANAQCPNSNWFVEWELPTEEKEDGESQVEKTYFVKFTRMKELVFRLDAVHPEGLLIEEILTRIGAYSFDTQTLGYPFPMQQIHDEVRISRMDKEQIFNTLKTDWISQGGNIKDFEELFFNYHDQLDIVSSGR